MKRWATLQHSKRRKNGYEKNVFAPHCSVYSTNRVRHASHSTANISTNLNGNTCSYFDTYAYGNAFSNTFSFTVSAASHSTANISTNLNGNTCSYFDTYAYGNAFTNAFTNTFTNAFTNTFSFTVSAASHWRKVRFIGS
ncbi:hypothetical protein ACFLXQ_08010 [Chloroflexota bacterium]